MSGLPRLLPDWAHCDEAGNPVTNPVAFAEASLEAMRRTGPCRVRVD